MKVYSSIDEAKDLVKPIITTGTFDGVHQGHHKIISALNQIGKAIGGEVVLITFHPHPRIVLHPDSSGLKLLNTMEEKVKLLEKAGVQHLIIQPFSKEFSRLTALEYVRDLLVNKLKMHTLVIGYDHHFGRNRTGNLDHIKEYAQLFGFDIKEVSALGIDETNVSSTKIRDAILEGDIEKANTFLGYNFLLSGAVVVGEQLGRKLGFPTANIEISNPNKLIPGKGVYAVRILLEGKTYKGMLNIGFKPTFGSNKKEEATLEVNIFDYDKDIYGEEIELEIVKRLRDEVRFETIDLLKEQLKKDKLQSLST